MGENERDAKAAGGIESMRLTTAEVKFWLAEASSCVDRQDVELRKGNNYPFLVNYYEGFEKIDALHPHVSSEQQSAIINEYFPSTNSLISEIMFQNPDILLDATKPDAEEDLPLMKSALNYLFKKSNALVENRVALFDMLYAGYCAVETDILPPQDDNQSRRPDQPDEKGIFGKTLDGIKSAIGLDTPEEAEKNFARLSPPIESNFATAQGTYIRRYDPLDVPLDWRAERVGDRRYNLKKVWMSKAEFDVKYKEFKDKVTATDERFEYSKHDMIMHSQKILLYEFQIRLKGGIYRTIVLCPQIKTSDIDMFDRPYTTNGFNMKIGTLHKYGKLYPKSFAQINKNMQDEMNNYVKHLMEIAERNIPKYVTNKNKVKIDAKDALMNKRVNALVEVDGDTANAITPLQPTVTAYENKELLAIFQDQKNKLWSVSESRISGRSQAKFATDLAIQDQSFKSQNLDIQDGLRLLIKDELETGKDIIVTFWDDEIFLQVTGHEKMKWYEPQVGPDPKDPNKTIVLNPLTDILTADYDVDIDIASASRPNREQQLQKMTFFMQQLVASRQMIIEQGKDINIDEIKRISKEFGWNPDKLFVDHQPAMVPNVPTATGETISPEEDARRQAEAKSRLQGAGNAVM